jgi:hypothetical protein
MAAAPTPVAVPPHLIRRKTIDIVLADDRGFGTFAGLGNKPLALRRDRRQWSRLRTRGQHGRARDKSKGEFQKVAAFHHVPPLHILRDSFAAPR